MSKFPVDAPVRECCKGLHKVIGPGEISKFAHEVVRPHVVRPDLEAGYAETAKDLVTVFHHRA